MEIIVYLLHKIVAEAKQNILEEIWLYDKSMLSWRPYKTFLDVFVKIIISSFVIVVLLCFT